MPLKTDYVAKLDLKQLCKEERLEGRLNLQSGFQGFGNKQLYLHCR